MKSQTIQIRDPIHGTLHVSRKELALVDHAAYQRLRSIKQLGLADLAFPGATHTRYAHGLGTMHVGVRMFDALLRHFDLAAPDGARLRQIIRLAALFHDLGHPPLSHATEAFMPNVSALELGAWQNGPTDRLANHEDYTLKILTDSDLTTELERQFGSAGISADDVAALIAGRTRDEAGRARFIIDGRDWMPLLNQCVSSELDADRMDYLLRDSYFAGVPYGRFDLEWLLENLIPVVDDGAVFLGLEARASLCFEDYLLSRYHMFMSIYFHHVPIGYEVMLAQFFGDDPEALRVPTAIKDYLHFDDIRLVTALRTSQSVWAQRIVARDAYRMVHETKFVESEGPRAGQPSTQRLLEALGDAGISAIPHTVKGRLSKYFSTGSNRPESAVAAPSLFIVERGHPTPVEEYSPLYRRYAGAIELSRVYVEPQDFARAEAISRGLLA